MTPHLVELQFEGIALLSAVLGADGRPIHIDEHKCAMIGHDDPPL